MNRGTGYIHADLRSNWEFCGSPRSTLTDNRNLCGPVTNQGASNSCVAHSLSNAIEFLNIKHAISKPKPCILSIYALARIHSGYSLDQDCGASLPASMSAVSAHGYMPESDWPFSPDDVRKQPSWGVARSCFDKIGLLWHSISGDREGLIDAAIEAELPVVVGSLVRDDYIWWDGRWDVWQGCESGGGHAMLIVGKDEESYWVKGSWGTSHGINGYSRISRAHICNSTRTRTVAVIEGV